MGSAQLAHTFGSPGQANIACSTTAGWGSGQFDDATISAISAQPLSKAFGGESDRVVLGAPLLTKVLS